MFAGQRPRGNLAAIQPGQATVTISGDVVNAVDGRPLKQGTLVSDGYTPSSYAVLASPTLLILHDSAFVAEVPVAAKDATFSITLPARDYECAMIMPGYDAFFASNCTGMGLASRQTGASLITPTLRIALSPLLMPGQARAVLTWNPSPKDLDLHLLVPSDSPGGKQACDLSWQTKACNGGHSVLDVDQTNGKGPETMTVRHFEPGTYIYSVQEYGGSKAKPKWASSGATVHFFTQSQKLTFTVAGGDGYLSSATSPDGHPDTPVWVVFLVDGLTRHVTMCTPQLCPIAQA